MDIFKDPLPMLLLEELEVAMLSIWEVREPTLHVKDYEDATLSWGDARNLMSSFPRSC